MRPDALCKRIGLFLPTYESFDHAKVYVRSLWTVSAVSVTATRSRAYFVIENEIVSRGVRIQLTRIA